MLGMFKDGMYDDRTWMETFVSFFFVSCSYFSDPLEFGSYKSFYGKFPLDSAGMHCTSQET